MNRNIKHGEIDFRLETPEQVLAGIDMSRIRAYATIWNADGSEGLKNMPLTQSPGPMHSDETWDVRSSREIEPGVWETYYRHRSDRGWVRKIVRPA